MTYHAPSYSVPAEGTRFPANSQLRLGFDGFGSMPGVSYGTLIGRPRSVAGVEQGLAEIAVRRGSGR